MRFSNINDLVEGLMKDVEHEKKGKKTLSTKEKALRKALTESKNAIDRNNHRGGKKLADYRRSFEELLESYYPGKPWYQITSVNIDNEFANGTTPEQLITKLVENIKVDKVKSTNKSTTHTKLNESKSSKRLTEGSLASKAKAVVQKLRGDVEEDGMYEELDYDDFELEEDYSEIDDIDEGSVCEGRNADRARKALKRIQGGMNEDLPDGCTGKGCRCKGTLNGPTDDEIGLQEGGIANKVRAKIQKLRGGMNEDLPDGCKGKGCGCKGTLNGPTDDEIGLDEGRNADRARSAIKKLMGGMNEDLPDGCKGKGCGCKGTLNRPTKDETGLKESKRAKRFDPKAIAEEYGLTCESDEYGCNNFCNGDECVASFDDEEFADIDDPDTFLRQQLDAVRFPSDDEFDDEDWDDEYIPDDDGYIPDEEGYMPEGLADTARSKAKKLRSITGGR